MNKIQLRRLDMNLLLIFMSVARHQNLTAAANELGLTKSAISHALSRLREVFGDELFVRRQNGMKMTARATTLAPKISSIIQMTSDTLALEDSFQPSTDRRTLRFGTWEYGTLVFGPLLAKIIEMQAPNMHLSIIGARRAEIMEQISNYSLDLGLGVFYGRSGDYTVESLLNDRYVVVARRDHSVVRGSLSRGQYLQAEHLLVMGEAHAPLILESTFSRLGISRNVVMTLPLYMAGFTVAAGGDRLLTVPGQLAYRYARQFNLEIYPMPFPSVDFAASLIWNHSGEHDPGVRWLRAKLHEITAELSRSAIELSDSGHIAAARSSARI